MDDLDRITRELAEVQDALLALPDDAFAERYELLRRRDELRNAAATARAGLAQERPTADIQAELAGLRRRLAELEARRIDLVQQAGSSAAAAGPGADGWGGIQLNTAIDRAQGLDEVRARIGVLKGILLDRGVDPGN